jgi:hypothetical protein
MLLDLKIAAKHKKFISVVREAVDFLIKHIENAADTC